MRAQARQDSRQPRGGARVGRVRRDQPGPRRPFAASRVSQCRTSSSYAGRPISSTSSGRWTRTPARGRRAPRCCPCSTSPGRGRPAPQPRRSYSPIETTSTSVPSGRSTRSYVRRIGSCQHTSGLVSQRVPPAAQRQRVQRAAGAAGEAGPVEEDAGAVDHAGSCGAPSSSVSTSRFGPPWRTARSPGRARAAHFSVRFSSSLSEKCAPSVQQPSSGRVGVDAGQPLPKMQVQRDVSQVRSQRKTCSASAGSGNSTQARGKSRSTSGTGSAYGATPARIASQPCASASSTSGRTPCTCWSSTPTAARRRCRRSRTRPSCGSPSSLDDDGRDQPPTAPSGWSAFVARGARASPRTRASRRCSRSRPPRSATRANGDDVLDHGRATETGVDLQVLSGEDEARLTFLAVRRWFGWSSGRLLVLTSAAARSRSPPASTRSPTSACSLPLGAGRLTRDLLHGDPPDPDAVRALRKHVRARDRPRPRPGDPRSARPTAWSATSKTFRSLARIAGAAPSDDGPYVRRVAAPRTTCSSGSRSWRR